MKDKHNYSRLDTHLIREYDDAMALLNKDMVARKLDARLKEDLVIRALTCGQQAANWYLAQTQEDLSIKEFIQNNKISIKKVENFGFNDVVIFGQFTPPNTIMLNQSALDHAYGFVRTRNIMGVSHDDLETLVLGHELFHWIESQFETTIFTRKHREIIWRFMGFTMKSRIAVLSEIAAMEFSRRIHKGTLSAYIMNELI